MSRLQVHFLYLAVLLFVAAAPAMVIGDELVPGDFDLYLLAQSWLPAFCCTSAASRHTDSCGHDQGASLVGRTAGSHLTLHGLWPQYSSPRPNHRFPEFCGKYSVCKGSNAPFCHSNGEQEGDCKLDESAFPGFCSPGGLGTHEWPKHGSCSGLSASQYYESALELWRHPFLSQERTGTPELLSSRVGGTVLLSELLEDYASRGGEGLTRGVVPICQSRGCFLSEVRSCWQKQSNNHPGEPMPCTDQVLNDRNSCANKGCDEIMLTAPGSCAREGTHGSGSAQRCVRGRKGPKCSSTADCAGISGCVRCANSGYCTAEPLHGRTTVESNSAGEISPEGRCIPGRKGPRCSRNADCSGYANCIRCASSGHCTDVPLPKDL